MSASVGQDGAKSGSSAATVEARRPYAPRMAAPERREHLLDAALRVIVREGYGGVSIQAVAAEAGVTRPVVYDVFGNLGELLGALLQREERRALEQLASVMPLPPPDGATPEDVLVRSIEAFLDAVQASPDTWRLILLPVDGTPATVRDQFERARATVAGQIEELVVWGLGRRGIADLDAEMTAQSLHVLGEHAARLVLTDPERFTPERIATFTRALAGRLLEG